MNAFCIALSIFTKSDFHNCLRYLIKSQELWENQPILRTIISPLLVSKLETKQETTRQSHMIFT